MLIQIDKVPCGRTSVFKVDSQSVEHRYFYFIVAFQKLAIFVLLKICFLI